MTAEREIQIKQARKTLQAGGYVVLKAKSHHDLLRRVAAAEARQEFAEEREQTYRRWAQSHADEERFLRNRLTFVYGVAREKGATVDELRGGDEQANTILRYPSGDGTQVES